MTRRLPPTASVTETAPDGRLVMPAALRNVGAISDLLAELIGTAPPASAPLTALEIASGTGQHILHHATRFPQISWQPSDVNPDHIRSIDAYATEAPTDAIRPAIHLNATEPGWADGVQDYDLILLVNLLHLISADEAATVIAEIGKALRPGGACVLYGPFMRGGELTSDGDRQFHADLIGADPAIGYKDDFDITDQIHASGMELARLVEMPANNLAFVARRF